MKRASVSRSSRESETKKKASTGQLLVKASRLWNEHATLRVTERHPGFRTAHTQLLPHVDPAGTRLTDLAERVGTSKQAVGELVDDLVAMGVLERAKDPTDARARLVRFTAKGQKAVASGLGLLDDLEKELGKIVGAARMKELQQLLASLVGALEARSDVARGRS